MAENFFIISPMCRKLLVSTNCQRDQSGNFSPFLFESASLSWIYSGVWAASPRSMHMEAVWLGTLYHILYIIWIYVSISWLDSKMWRSKLFTQWILEIFLYFALLSFMAINGYCLWRDYIILLSFSVLAWGLIILLFYNINYIKI